MSPIPIPTHGTVLVGLFQPDDLDAGADVLPSPLDADVERALQLCESGAHIVDVNVRPGSPRMRSVARASNQDRMVFLIDALVGRGVTVSVGTTHADTARLALAAGASIVSDVTGGGDPGMFAAILDHDCQYVVGPVNTVPGARTPVHIQAITEIAARLRARADDAAAAGIPPERIVVDPCLGFARAATNEWEILRGLSAILDLGFPVMVDVSRKRFLSSLLPPGATLEDRDVPTAVLNAQLADFGVNALRVHNVAATKSALETLDVLTGT